MVKSPTSISKNGFTLAEILLAMMVFAIAITTILGLLARSIETADSILIKDEAINLSSAVDSYMSELAFADAYGIVQRNESLYAYNYRADPQVVVPVVRKSTDTEITNEVAAREGRLFEVKLQVSPANPFTGTLPADPDGAGSNGFPSYDQAVLVILADFYNVPTATTSADAATVDPVFSFTFAVRR